jgi:hypothetical protein
MKKSAVVFWTWVTAGAATRIHEDKRSGRCFEVLSSKGLT